MNIIKKFIIKFKWIFFGFAIIPFAALYIAIYDEYAVYTRLASAMLIVQIIGFILYTISLKIGE